MKLSITDKLLVMLILMISLSACKNILSKKQMKKLQDLEQLTYQFRDASVPPPYHRSYTLVINKDTALLSVDSYGNILAEKTYEMPKDGLKKIGEAIVKHKIALRKEKKENKGCTGGTSRIISYSCKGEKENFSGSAYYCGGDQYGTLSGDIDSFFVDLKAFAPDLHAVVRSTE